LPEPEKPLGMSVFEDGPQERTPGLGLSPVTPAEESASRVHLVAVAFASADEARSALTDLTGLLESGRLRLEDACVVVRETGGAIEVTDTMHPTGAFHIFGRHAGIRRNFQQKLGAVLKPGCAALVVLGNTTDQDAIAKTVATWKAEVVTTDLDADAEADLRSALARRE
jgi:uncharacterized membrane protein